MKQIFLIATILLTINFANSQSFNRNKEDLYNCKIFFDENWKFLLLHSSDIDNNYENLVSIYNPLKIDETIYSRYLKRKYIRLIDLTKRNINDYLNGKVIYPNCNIKEPVIDYYSDGAANDTTFENKQSVMAKVYCMSINSDLTDNVLYEGQGVFFNKDHEIENEDCMRYFEDGTNLIVINNKEYKDGNHGWTYGYFTKNKLGEYDKVAAVLIDRSVQTFYFYNQYRKQQMIFMIAPSYVYKEMGITNNAVTRFTKKELDNYFPTTKSKYDFFNDFFNDYPMMKFRNMSQAWKVPINDINGIDLKYINKYMSELNVTFNYTIDQLIYETFIADYSNNKYNPYKPYKYAKATTVVLCE